MSGPFVYGDVMAAKSLTVNELTREWKTLAVAISGAVRREKFVGREWLVAPVVAVRQMVLGDELLPTETIREAIDLFLWEGKPITVDHPEMNGQGDVAGSKRQVATREIGRFWNTHLDGDALKGELWIDVEAAGRVRNGQLVMQKLEAGGGLEVSTGYWAARDNRTGTYEGKPYRAIQRAMIPDHLALLPNGVGKCSIHDGCGAPRFNEESDVDKKNGCTCEGGDGGTPEPKENEATKGFIEGLKSMLGLNEEKSVEGGTVIHAQTVNIGSSRETEGGEHSGQEESMKKAEVIAKLVENKAPFSEDELKAMDEEKLAFLASQLEESEPAAGGEGAGAAEGASAAEAGAGDGGEGVDPEEKKKVEEEAGVAQIDAAALNKLISEAVGKAIANHQVAEEKSDLVKRILAANEAWSEDELKEMSVSALEKIAAQTATRNFTGRGGARTYDRGEEQSYNSQVRRDGPFTRRGEAKDA